MVSRQGLPVTQIHEYTFKDGDTRLVGVLLEGITIWYKNGAYVHGSFADSRDLFHPDPVYTVKVDKERLFPQFFINGKQAATLLLPEGEYKLVRNEQ